MFLATSFVTVATYTENGADGTGQEVLGTGTPDTSWYSTGPTAFTLTTADQLAGLAALVNSGNDFDGKTITLGNNIDLSDYNISSGFNSGKGWIPIGNTSTNTFKGLFDGEGKKITGLEADDDTGNYIGLFGYLMGTVYRLGVEGADVKGSVDVGIIAGGTGANITASYTTGTVAGERNIGGIVGSIDTGTIRGCYSTADVTGSGDRVGGIAGYVWSDAGIDGCYSTGKVVGESCVGGIAGEAEGSITYCYSTSEVIGTGYNVGGIAGANGTGGTDRCAALNSKVEGINKVGRVVGLVPVESTNNKAFDNMVVNRNTTGIGDDEGTDVTAEEIWADGSLDMFKITPWPSVAPPNGKLPGLEDPWDIPAHLLPARAYTVTFSMIGITGSGTLVAEVGTTELTSPADVEEGSNVVFTATPSTGYRIKEWTVNGVAQAGTSNTLTVEDLSENTTVTVEFESTAPPITYYTVTFGVTGGNGSLTARLLSETLTSPASVPEDSYVVFTAAPNSGYQIKAWYRDGVHEAGVGTDNPVAITVGENVNFTVEFEETPITPDSADDGLPIALIAGIIVGVAIAGVGAYWFLVRKP